MGCDPALEEAFSASWDYVVASYTEWGAAGPESASHICRRLLELISELRDAGYDRTLRAGQSVSTFIVSRSRAHGMQQDQPSIALYPRDDRVLVTPSWLPDRKRDALAIGYECDPRLIELLDELVSRPIT
jgi:hypothetical protein